MNDLSAPRPGSSAPAVADSQARNTGDGRTGTFTSGIVSIWREWRIALYFSGWKHAGENLAKCSEATRGGARSAHSETPDSSR
jgi:hypothetical protein